MSSTMTSSSNAQHDAVFWLYTASAAVAATGAYYAYSRSKKHERKWPIVPGALPFIGHAHLVGGVPNMIAKTTEWADLHGQETGCYEMNLAGSRFIVVCNEERAKELLKRRPYGVTRMTRIREGFISVGAGGVFSAEGDQWKQEHKIMAASLSKKNLQDYLPIFHVVVDRLVEKWAHGAAAGDTLLASGSLDDSLRSLEARGVVPINTDLGSMASDAIAMAAMDRDYDFINNPDSQESGDVYKLMASMLYRGFSSVWYWRIPLIGQYLDGCARPVSRVRRLLFQVVTDFETAREEGAATGHSRNLFLQKAYTAMMSEQTRLSKAQIVANLATLFLAGTDTTSTSLMAALYELAIDPELQLELAEESNACGNAKKLEELTVSDIIHTFPRIKSFLHEVHRFYGSPMIPLQAGTNDVQFCGTTLPKGTNIVLLQGYVSYNRFNPASDVPLGPNGEHPSVFCPRRWLSRDEEDSNWTCPPPSTRNVGFLPFGHGIRACPGRSYAESLSYIFLARLLQRYQFELAPNHEEVKFHFHVNMTPDCDICLKLEPRATS